MKIPTKDSVIEIWYEAKDGQPAKIEQGKLLYNFMDFPIFYRDIHRWSSTIFKTRQTLGDKSMNLDRRVFMLCREAKVKAFYYNDMTAKKLYTITLKVLENAILKGDVLVEFMGGHTQLFIPYFLFTMQEPLNNKPKWINEMFEINELVGPAFDEAFGKREAVSAAV